MIDSNATIKTQHRLNILQTAITSKSSYQFIISPGFHFLQPVQSVRTVCTAQCTKYYSTPMVRTHNSATFDHSSLKDDAVIVISMDNYNIY